MRNQRCVVKDIVCVHHRGVGALCSGSGVLTAFVCTHLRCAERGVQQLGFEVAFGEVVEFWLAMPSSALLPKPTAEVVVASLTSFSGYSLYPAAGSVSDVRMCAGATPAHRRIPGVKQASISCVRGTCGPVVLWKGVCLCREPLIY